MGKRTNRKKPTHPGEIVKLDILEPLNLTVTEAAEVLNVSREHLSAFINGHVACSKDMAKRLAIALGTSVEVWLGLQHALDVWELERNRDARYRLVGTLVDG